MNTPEHHYVGPMIHDRIIGAIELCCRRREMLLIENRRDAGLYVPPMWCSAFPGPT
jgi:hypothetical protein